MELHKFPFGILLYSKINFLLPSFRIKNVPKYCRRFEKTENFRQNFFKEHSDIKNRFSF